MINQNPGNAEPENSIPKHAKRKMRHRNLQKKERHRAVKKRKILHAQKAAMRKKRWQQREARRKRGLPPLPPPIPRKRPRLHAPDHDRACPHPVPAEQRWPPLRFVRNDFSSKFVNPNFHKYSAAKNETYKQRILRIQLKLLTTLGLQHQFQSLNPFKLKRYIYILYHPLFSQHYVGETYKGFLRFQGHYYSARNVALNTGSSGDRTLLHLAMARTSFRHWNLIVLEDLGTVDGNGNELHPY
jgi:hypothetical protein